MPTITNPPGPVDLYNGPALASFSEMEITLSRSRASLYRDIEAGRLKAIKVGNSRKIIVASARKLIEAAA